MWKGGKDKERETGPRQGAREGSGRGGGRGRQSSGFLGSLRSTKFGGRLLCATNVEQ